MAKKPTYEELEQRVKELENEIVERKRVEEALRDGNPYGISSISTDITDRKRAENALRESEERYRALFDRSLDCIYLHDFEGNFIDANPAALNLLGYKKEEILSVNFATLLSPDQIANALEGLEEVKRIGFDRSLREFRLQRKDGKVTDVETISALIYRDGKPYAIQGIARDITIRKQAEKDLRESEEHFRHAFENANTGVSLVSTDGHFIKVNDRLCEMFGYSKEKLEGMSVNDITHPEDLELSPDFYQRSTSGEIDNVVYEKRYIHCKGHLVWGQISSSIVRGSEGEPSYFISHVQDITQQKLAEEALKKSEEKFSKLFQASPTYISLATLKEGRLVAVNDAFTKITGYQPNEVIGRTFREIGLWPDPHDREEFIKQIEKYGSQHLQEVTLTRKDGSLIDGLWSVEKIELEGKAHLISMLVDITEKKQAEDALRESKENLDKAQKITHIGSWSRDLNLKQGEWSDELYRIYGLTPGDPADVPFEFVLSFVHPEDRELVATTLREAPEKKQPFGFEFRTIPIEGSERIVRNHGEVEYDETGNPVRLFGTAQDITETRKLQVQGQNSQKIEATSTLAGGIAHNFINALTPIIGNVDLLEMTHGQDETIMKSLKDMKTSGLRMAQLTSQLLAYAKGGKYNPQTLSLSDFVDATLPLIQHTLDPALRVETDLPLDIMNCKADNAQMQMVLSAIIANSNEAMEGPGRIRISTRNMDLDQELIKDHPGLKPGPYVCLSIEDDGKGMDEETGSKIFDPFFTTHFMGRGLGMAAVYGIIINHDGTITVDSELGKGTVVRIYLPAIEVEKEVKQKTVSRPDLQLPKGDATILVIEDEEDVMMFIRQILERFGYRVLEAMTGEKAVRLAKTFDGQIDLALLDIKLPDMEGGKVYPLIMEARPDLKVIVCSGYGIEGPPQEILDAGAEGFVQKPFHIVILAEKLKEVLEGK